MKKIVCLVLALALMLVVSSALAEPSVSASYADGVLSVSGSGIDSYYKVLVDDNDTSRSLTPSSPSVSISIALTDGSHRVTIYNDVHGSASTSIYVGVKPTEAPVVPTEAPVVPTEAPVVPTEAPVVPTEAPVVPTEAPVVPTEAPTGPVQVSGVSYKNGVISFTVSGLRGYGEIWLDGASTGRSVSANGGASLSQRLKAGVHTLTVYVPTYNETSTVSFEVVIQQPTISASYTKVGQLVYTVGGINNPSEIWLDGGATSQAVSADGTYTLNVILTEGSHTILVYDATNNLKDSYTFTVTHIAQVIPGKAATCTETGLSDGEECAICGEILKAQEVLPMIDHTSKTVPGKAATCTEAGLTDGEECAVCGKELKAQEAIPALGHAYQIVDRSNGRITYRCSRCGVSFYEVVKDNKNTYGSIVKDATGIDVDYTAEGNAKTKTLVITADLAKATTTELGLYLDSALIDQLKAEGYATVEFVNDKATLVIELDEINPAWFDTNSAIWFYVFSTDPAVEGTLVKVEAQISGTDKVPATSYTGVELKK